VARSTIAITASSAFACCLRTAVSSACCTASMRSVDQALAIPTGGVFMRGLLKET
jgi:hypothetical protein